jgi:hypothetical protein
LTAQSHRDWLHSAANCGKPYVNQRPRRGKKTTERGLRETPSPSYAPRSLRSIAGARLELARLYAQTKNGEVDPIVSGRCAYILNSLIGSARDHQFEERLAELEASLKHNQPNGHHRRGLRQ